MTRRSAVSQEYDPGVSRKVRKTLTLDPELVASFGEDPQALSATINTILHEELLRRGRRAALASVVERLDAEFGEPDAEDVERFRRALG